MPDLKATIIEAVGDVEGELESEESLLSEWRGVVSTLSESEVRRVRDYSRQLADDLERRLRESESDLDRATRQIRFLQGENQSKRISAELELTRDAITVLGIALQDLATFSTPKSQEIADIESKITLALSVLGTRPFGEIGEIVQFDPFVHEATPVPSRGVLVRIVAPGLTYVRQTDSPVTLVKILVQEEFDA